MIFIYHLRFIRGTCLIMDFNFILPAKLLQFQIGILSLTDTKICYYFCLQWALNISKKPIVTIGWLQQCWIEHRVVPQEAYRVLPFSGLNISVSRIPAGSEFYNILFLLR